VTAGVPSPDDTWRQAFESVAGQDGQLSLWAVELGVSGELAKDRGDVEEAAAEAARGARVRPST